MNRAALALPNSIAYMRDIIGSTALALLYIFSNTWLNRYFLRDKSTERDISHSTANRGNGSIVGTSKFREHKKSVSNLRYNGRDHQNWIGYRLIWQEFRL